jgi:hypothetical protein
VTLLSIVMRTKKTLFPILGCLLLLFPMLLVSQEKETFPLERKIHYAPEGNSFVLKNGIRKFNRALYGTNTGFRVEAGDLPEFALYSLEYGSETNKQKTGNTKSLIVFNQ